MPADSSHDLDELFVRLDELGQQALHRHLAELDPPRRRRLADQLEAIDWKQVASMQALARAAGTSQTLAVDPAWLAAARTPSGPRLRHGGQSPTGPLEPREAIPAGEQLLSSGAIGALLVAGGQATRLRCDGPKGLYRIGPVSNASLFELLLGRIRATGERFAKPVPLAIMTSTATDEATRRFLEENAWFGLPSEHVLIFRQGDLPALSIDSFSLLLDASDHVAVAPDGHGGLLSALAKAGGLTWFSSRGVQHVASFQVDNPLAMPLDPEFLGYHALAAAEFSTQVVEKREPRERVGVVVEHDGRHRVIEYSDLSDELAQARTDDRRLRLRAGSIAVHAFALAFLERAAAEPESLPLHLARKAVPCLDAAGRLVRPKEPNAFKFERFIFDLMPLARRVLTVEIDPAEGFAPLKNPPGADADAPEHVQTAMTALARERCRAAGIDVADGIAVELAADTFTADDLRRHVPAGRVDRPQVV